MGALKLSTEFIFEKNNSQLLVDRTNKIVFVEWQGEVEIETAQSILNGGADLIEDGSANKILLDRKNLIEFTKETSKWIKDDLLRNRGKELVKQVEKVASVRSQTTMGNLFANVVSAAIRIIFPGIRMKNFEEKGEALEWLLM